MVPSAREVARSQISVVPVLGDARTDLKPLATTSSQVWPLIVHRPLFRAKSNLRVVTASVSETVIAGWAGKSEAGMELFFVLNGSSVTSNRITLLVCV